MSYNLLKGKKGIVFGALNESSIAWHVAELAHKEGAQLVLSNTAVAMRMGSVQELAKKTDAVLIPADATNVNDLNELFKKTTEHFGDLRNHLDIRRDPRLLLDGAKTIVTLAFSFCQPKKRPASFPRISAYAGGEDYHDVIRKRLKAAIAPFSATEAGFRICVDTAPIAERYWARKSGLGFIARNGMLVVPGAGNQEIGRAHV